MEDNDEKIAGFELRKRVVFKLQLEFANVNF